MLASRELSYLPLRYAIDVIILTTGLQGLSAISNYLWLLWAAVSNLHVM